MTEITIYNLTAAQCLDIVYQLRETMTQGQDFKYEFVQGGYNWEMMEEIPYKTIFYFADPADATAFALKYS